MTTIRTLINSARTLLTGPRALAIFAGLYALLLATLYWFIATREATVWQVVVTIFLVVLIPVELFILQAAIVDHAREPKVHWRQILRDAGKLLVVTIPILIIGLALFALLNKWQLRFPVPKPAVVSLTPPSAAKPQPLHWPTLVFATVRCLLFGVALPLATIHLWIAVVARDVRSLTGGGAKAILKRIGNALARAFASDSVLTYALGLIVFALIPYAVLFVPISPKGTKTDFAVFIARLVIAFAFTLIGWIVTLTALAKTNIETSPAPSAEPVTNAPAEAAA